MLQYSQTSGSGNKERSTKVNPVARAFTRGKDLNHPWQNAPVFPIGTPLMSLSYCMSVNEKSEAKLTGLEPIDGMHFVVKACRNYCVLLKSK